MWWKFETAAAGKREKLRADSAGFTTYMGIITIDLGPKMTKCYQSIIKLLSRNGSRDSEGI
jgi:hypothetical protein